MATFIHLIADYGPSDPAFSEVVHRLTYEDPTINVQTTEVPPFSTIATGFWIEQLGLHNPAFDGLMIYSNTAPRTEDAAPGRADEGGRPCYLELENGIPVVAVDAGYNLSFVRDAIREFREIDTPVSRSQFRSRDYFPKRVAELADGDMGSLGPERTVQDIPPKPESVVCHVDGYGNIKTSIEASEFDPDGDTVQITINSETMNIVVRDAVSTVEQGTVALIPGSAGGNDPYMEVFMRGGSAATAFDHPDPGDEITIH
ncbi:SAM hydrolase/SAM-dependent halogenase family protein [Halorubrum sp. HHNYT27]|uniref:SAM hydrolase/SAM-dependent halogenase family protein n=1 Tax=Halorubrum sp. HHNYT27 TaxID=3402275 RepID=UPI003EBF80A1